MYTIPGIKFDNQVDPLHALSILVTFAIAVLLSVFFEAHKKKDSTQKEIMIKRVDRVLNTLEELHKAILTGKIDFQTAVSLPKRLNKTFDYIWESLKINKINVKIEKSEIINLIRDLKDLLTNTPTNEERKLKKYCPITVNDNLLIYASPRVTEICSKLEEINNKLFQTQLNINAN
ncbi:MAG TPA: hypothetical protein VMV56_10880 [Williamwhitmania sp.]|nr:hypothetical protein [Williamwhitmania sp.]